MKNSVARLHKLALTFRNSLSIYPTKSALRVCLSTIIALALLHGRSAAQAGILFQSSWDTATGSTEYAWNDGTKWFGGSGPSGRRQNPIVYAGGPGGHNYLNMRTVGDGGWGNPYYMNWFISGGVNNGDVFRNPADLYVRFYFRVHQDWADGGGTHWFQGINDVDHSQGEFFLEFIDGGIDEWPTLNTDFTLVIEDYESGRFAAQVAMQTERWYCYELRMHKIDASKERWDVRLDGVDITAKFYGISGSTYGKWLTDLYNSGWGFANEYHGNLWLTTYDQDALNSGWDVSCVEIRDDRWPGLIGDTNDTTPPTGTIQMTGTEGRKDRTASKTVTLTLSATDAGSGMGTGAQMQFSNDNATWSTAEAYKTSRTWDLMDVAAGQEQTRTVYVKYKDVAGNWSSAFSASIILDKKPPAAPTEAPSIGP